MTHLRFVSAAAIAALVFACLAGCGGGGKGVNPPAATGLGRITGMAEGAPSGGVTVRVDGTNLSAQTDQNGRFEIEGVPSGIHTLTATVENGSQGCAVVVEVEGGKETNVGELVLREAGQISGLVTSTATSEAVSDAAVTVVESVVTIADEMPHPVRTTQTNEYGSYTVSGLPVGEYVVTVDKEGFRSASFAVTVYAASTTPGDVALYPVATGETGAVKGTVYLSTDDGRVDPLVGVMVILTSADNPEPPPPLPPLYEQQPGGRFGYVGDEYWAYSGPDGTYSIEGVPPGRYVATAVRPGMQIDQQEVTIVAGQTTQADFTLVLVVPRFKEITGTVTNAVTAEPIAGAEVFAAMDYPPPVPLSGGTQPGRPRGSIIMPDPGECQMYAVTDEKGFYRLLVPDSVTVISAYALGFEPAMEMVGDRSVIDFKLQPAVVGEVALSGTVTTASSEGGLVPVEGADVYATPYSDIPGIGVPAVVFPATTNEAGHYEMKLAAGSYEVRAYKDVFTSEAVVLHLQGDATQDFVLQEQTLPAARKAR